MSPSNPDKSAFDISLDGRVALVTGGGSGIGRASALALAAQGARVAVVDVSEQAGMAVAEEIRARGGEAFALTANVADAASIDAMVGAIRARWGRIDFAHNNAGIGPGSGVVETTEADWDLTMSVNLRGAWLCMRAEIPVMKAQGGGVIVNTASIAGLQGASEGSVAYAVSKAGLIHLTRRAAVEYGPHNIRINAVCPGITATPAVKQHLTAEQQRASVASQPLGRMGEPEEIAATVVWLCSNAASFVTGVILPVDGGWCAR